MAKHMVCLTFDFDVMSGHIARGMTTPTPISRGEFGIVGASRILPLLQAQKIPTTWFIPGFTIETSPMPAPKLLRVATRSAIMDGHMCNPPC